MAMIFFILNLNKFLYFSSRVASSYTGWPISVKKFLSSLFTQIQKKVKCKSCKMFRGAHCKNIFSYTGCFIKTRR